MPDKLISYHYVRSGRMIVEVDGQPPTTVEAGEIAILPRNDPHLLASRTGPSPGRRRARSAGSPPTASIA